MSLKSAAGRGILIRDPGIFDKLPGVKNVFFDKTGTLTSGVFRILKWDTGGLDDRDLGAILAIEKKSDHPIARAIVSRLAGMDLPIPEVTGFEHIYTKGVSAEAWGSIYTITSGGASAPAANEINELITSTITVRKDGEAISEIMLGDSLKEDAKFAVRELTAIGYSVFIISGDKEENVKQVVERIGIPRENVFFGETPEGKSGIIARHGRSMMIGDGLNDAPALASADVGVAIQGSVGESMKVSDAYILNNDLFTILDLIGHGTAARATAKRNMALSISYNSIAGAFALAGYITPLAAAILMPAVSLLLLGSALIGISARSGGKRRAAA
jgi:Cu2+-exporting ATPase/Cu+-exporting ATPase